MLFDATRRPARVIAGPGRIGALWPRVRRGARRMGWGVADQGMSSLTNFAANIYIARQLGAANFGAFSLAFVTYSFALNASRGLSTDPLLVRFSGTDLPTWRRAVASSAGTATATGLAAGVLVLATTAFLGGATRAAFIALGLTLPGLLLQDSWRFAFFTQGRGALALLNDTIWGLALVAGLAIVHATHHETVFWVVFAWGASATLAAGVGPAQARVMPKLTETRLWLRAHRDIAPRYLAAGTTNSAAAQVVSYGVGLLLGLAALGAVQAASLLMGPYMVVLFGMGLVLLPEAVRLLRHSPQRLPQLCVLTSVVFSALAAIWGSALLIALPLGLGHALLGDLWRPTYALVLPTTFYVMAFAALGGAGLGLQALGLARRSLRASIVTSGAYVIFSIGGAAVAGAAGAITGGAIGMWAGAIVFWSEFRRALRESPLRPSEQPSPC